MTNRKHIDCRSDHTGIRSSYWSSPLISFIHSNHRFWDEESPLLLMADINGRALQSMVGYVFRCPTYRILIYISVVWLSFGLSLLYFMHCFGDKCKLRSIQVKPNHNEEMVSQNHLDGGLRYGFRSNFSKTYSRSQLKSWEEPGMDATNGFDCYNLLIARALSADIKPRSLVRWERQRRCNRCSRNGIKESDVRTE